MSHTQVIRDYLEWRTVIDEPFGSEELHRCLVIENRPKPTLAEALEALESLETLLEQKEVSK